RQDLVALLRQRIPEHGEAERVERAAGHLGGVEFQSSVVDVQGLESVQASVKSGTEQDGHDGTARHGHTPGSAWAPLSQGDTPGRETLRSARGARPGTGREIEQQVTAK